MIRAILMARFHQRYSDIDDMKYKDLIFFMRLLDAEDKYAEQKINEAKNKGRR